MTAQTEIRPLLVCGSVNLDGSVESWNLAQNADLEHAASSASPASTPSSPPTVPSGNALLVAWTDFLTTKFRGHVGDGLDV